MRRKSMKEIRAREGCPVNPPMLIDMYIIRKNLLCIYIYRGFRFQHKFVISE